MLIWLTAGLLSPSLNAQPDPSTNSPVETSEQLLREQKHFSDCLVYGYSPSLWVAYEGALYFAPKDDTQLKAIESMKAQRARYIAFTNSAARHEFAARVIARSGIEPAWQKQILLPYSQTNRSLMPTFKKAITILRSYDVLQNLGSGDALLRDGEGIYFVMDYGRGSGAKPTNACLVQEGTKTYKTLSGASKTVEAFTSLGLSGSERALLNSVVAAFRNESQTLNEQLAASKARADFQDHRARANDSAPSFQFLLAQDYLEGKGTVGDEKLGLEMMRKAAANGSGAAQAYLDGASKSQAVQPPH